MPTITNGKHSETLEKEQRICFNNFKRSALQILATSGIEFVCMYKGLSDGVAAPFEDRSFIFSLCFTVDKYRTYVCTCQQDFRMYVLFLCGNFCGI